MFTMTIETTHDHVSDSIFAQHAKTISAVTIAIRAQLLDFSDLAILVNTGSRFIRL